MQEMDLRRSGMQKSIPVEIAGSFSALLLPPGDAAWPQQPAMCAFAYYATQGTVVEGTVPRYTADSAFSPTGAHFVLQTAGSAIDARLAATSLFQTNPFSLAKHDSVRVVGISSAKHRWILLAALLLASLTAACGNGGIAGAGPQSPNEIPSTFFGMTLMNNADWPQISVGALGKGSMDRWPDLEPQRGDFDWHSMDAWVSIADRQGVDIFFSSNFVPPWAAADQTTCFLSPSGSNLCTSTVANIEEWDDFITAVATRYKGKLIYELWNEPDASSFTGTVADMVTLTTHEYNIIRSIDPGALILSPSPTSGGSGYMDQYFAAGGPTGVDVVTFHSYHSAPELKLNDIHNIQAVMAKYNLSSKPLWDTEGSWGTYSLTSDEQVGYVARDYLLHWSEGIPRYYWYAWDNANSGTLWGPTTGPRAAAVAYQQVYNWMAGATMSSPCAMASDSTWTCTLTRPGGYQALAVWNSATTMSYAPAGRYKEYLDLAGNTNPMNGSVTIGYNPILLVN